MTTTVTGGKKLAAWIRQVKAAQAGSVKGVDVGFFATAKYQDGDAGRRGGCMERARHGAQREHARARTSLFSQCDPGGSAAPA